MKLYENESLSVIKIDSFQPFIVRLDGKNFSKFTSGLYKPFDSIHTTDNVEIPTFAKNFFGNIETNEKLLKFFRYIFKNILSYYEKT